MKNKIKDLIISPHADDEVLGCGGILNKNSYVYYCGLDESLVLKDNKHRIGLNKKFQEIKDVEKYLGFSWDWNENTKVNYYKEEDLIKVFEDLINKLKPERIFIPYPSYNQDHRAVYRAALIALRPHDKNFFVKKILVYEQPHILIWEQKLFKSNYFIPVKIKRKLVAYSLYKSQVRGMRSAEVIKAIAKLNGAKSNCEYAEGFIIERWVE